MKYINIDNCEECPYEDVGWCDFGDHSVEGETGLSKKCKLPDRDLTGQSSGMICFYCSQKFSYVGQIKCKIDGRIIPESILLSKKPYKDCPLTLKTKEQ